MGRPPINVEVFPVAPDRWVAVVDHPDGPFSTETSTPEGVRSEVESVLRHVLGSGEHPYRLVDESSEGWDLTAAARQTAALGG